MTGKRWFQLAVTILFILLIIALLMQVSIIFYPVTALLDTLFIPLLFGGLLYYIALAFQTLLERNGLNRLSSITLIILVFALSVGGIGYFAVPMLAEESQKLIMKWPAFQQELESVAGYIISQRGKSFWGLHYHVLWGQCHKSTLQTNHFLQFTWTVEQI